MRLIFIRHGDPDYKADNLTEKGRREAELLAGRAARWSITKIFCSPLGRAQATARPLLERLGMTADTRDWLQEFYYYAADEKHRVCWDLLPEFYTAEKGFFDKDRWTETPYMKAGNVGENYEKVCRGIDGLLAEFGYKRDGMLYRTDGKKDNPNFTQERYQLVPEKNLDEDCTMVFFCHLGVMFTIIAHLTGLSPVQLWQGFFVAPASVTVLNSEERIRGKAFFRVERLGDTGHLREGGEPVSSSGYFCDVLQET